MASQGSIAAPLANKSEKSSMAPTNNSIGDNWCIAMPAMFTFSNLWIA